MVSGSEEAILMVEAGANEISEAEILDALDIAHGEIKKICAAQRELAEKAGKTKMEIEVPQVDEAIAAAVKDQFGAKLEEATQVVDKLERQDATKAVEDGGPRGHRRRLRGRRLLREARPGPARVRQAGEGDHPPPHRRRQEAPRRPCRR